jgi:DNA modification methylase
MIDLRLGDCLEVMKTIKDNSIDAIITDLPYGTTACKWDSIIPFDLMWEQLNRIIKPNGAIVLFGSEPFSSALRMSNIKNYKYDWKWVKNRCTNVFMAKKQPLRNSEDIIVFYKSQPTYNYIKEPRAKNSHNRKNTKIRNTSQIYKNPDMIIKELDKLSYPKNVKYFNSVHPHSKEYAGHPTQKPVLLMEYLIKTYTNENETVLDFTMGSGTTGVACVNTNRNFIGIEMDENYFKIAKDITLLNN